MKIANTKWGWVVMKWPSADRWMYLHTDGQWRESTWNEQAQKYTGLFKTRREAREAAKVERESHAA